MEGLPKGTGKGKDKPRTSALDGGPKPSPSMPHPAPQYPVLRAFEIEDAFAPPS